MPCESKHTEVGSKAVKHIPSCKSWVGLSTRTHHFSTTGPCRHVWCTDGKHLGPPDREASLPFSVLWKLGRWLMPLWGEDNTG